MLKHVLTVGVLTGMLLGSVAQAQQNPAPQAKQPAPVAQTPLPKAGPGEKVCTHKFPDGTPRAWICKEAEPCCAWDEIRYVKCGSPVLRCL